MITAKISQDETIETWKDGTTYKTVRTFKGEVASYFEHLSNSDAAFFHIQYVSALKMSRHFYERTNPWTVFQESH